MSDYLSILAPPAATPTLVATPLGNTTNSIAPVWVQDFNQSNTWEQLLGGDGWTYDSTDGHGVGYWVRPGKDRRLGHSATTNYENLDKLIVFTTSIPWLPPESYDRWAYMVFRVYGGDFKAASRDYMPKDRQHTDPSTLLPGGKPLKQPGTAKPDEVAGDRKLRLTPASAIKPKPVLWLWADRIALGTLCLLAGREGIGKSSFAYLITSWITRGELAGAFYGKPRSVIIAATEDSWEHTIVPRLMAVNADLDRVYRVDVDICEGLETSLSMPADLVQLGEAVVEVDAALILLDPLMSRLSANLDTHKDADVRLALEPLVALADRCNVAILGLIHVNKSGGGDALNMIMGSRAFGAVARAVLYAMNSPEDESVKFLGQPKNNLGRSDLPTLTYRVEGVKVADHEDGEIWTGRVELGNETTVTIGDALAASNQNPDARSATEEAMAYLVEYLESVGGSAPSAAVKSSAKTVGHSASTVQRARKNLKLISESSGFPQTTTWSLPTFTQAGESGALAQLQLCQIEEIGVEVEEEKPRSETVVPSVPLETSI